MNEVAPLLRPVLSSVGLGAFCLAADYVVFKREDVWQRVRYGSLVKAALDNVAHALVGGWSWANVILLMAEPFSALRVLQVACCTCMASAIDLDHFIAAGSISLKKILSLKQRPFAHNTTLVLVGTGLLYIMVYTLPPLSSHPLTKDLPAMFLVATLSHHLRDADRRGVWFGPFGSTPPIPFRLYPLLVILLPFLQPQANILAPIFKWVWSIITSVSHNQIHSV